MRVIIDNLLYDTEKSQIVWESEYLNDILYATKNGRLFRVFADSVTSTDQTKLKNFLGSVNPDKYIEIFGEVEEA